MRARNRMFTIVTLVMLAALLIPQLVHAQLNARGLGMGGAYTALARGVHAVDWNPANLGLPDNSRFSFTFISAGVSVNNNVFSKGMYDKYFVDGANADNEIYWSEDDVSDILGLIPDDGLKLNIQSQIRTFSFSVGRFALSLSTDVGVNVNLDKNFLAIPLQGTQINKQYTFNEAGGDGLGFGAVGVSWGQPIPVSFAEHFSVGTTVRAFYGGGYGKSDNVETEIDLKPYGTNLEGLFDVTYAYNSGKLGWGMDLGAAAMLDDKITVSLAIANVLGSIPWENDVKQEHGLFSADSLGVLTDFEEDFIDSTWTTELGSFSSRLPGILRIGGSYREGDMLVAADYTQGFSEGAFSSGKPRFSVGTEWSGIPWLPLRAGVVLGGKIGFGASFGIGIRPGGFALDLAIMSKGGITPGSSKGIAFGIDLGLDLAPIK